MEHWRSSLNAPLHRAEKGTLAAHPGRHRDRSGLTHGFDPCEEAARGAAAAKPSSGDELLLAGDVGILLQTQALGRQSQRQVQPVLVAEMVQQSFHPWPCSRDAGGQMMTCSARLQMHVDALLSVKVSSLV